MFGKMKAAMAATAAAGLLALAGASAADAATITGGGAFTGNAPNPPGARLTVTGPSGTVKLDCANATGSGTVNNGTYSTFPANVGTITPVFNGGTTTTDCNGPAGLGFTVTCTSATLQITGNPVSNTTPGEIPNVHCVITFPTIPCTATVTGTVKVSYTNPTGSPARGRLTVLDPNVAGNQALSISASTCPSTILPNGTNNAKFGGAVGSGTGQGPLVYTLTTTGPTIVP